MKSLTTTEVPIIRLTEPSPGMPAVWSGGFKGKVVVDADVHPLFSVCVDSQYSIAHRNPELCSVKDHRDTENLVLGLPTNVFQLWLASIRTGNFGEAAPVLGENLIVEFRLANPPAAEDGEALSYAPQEKYSDWGGMIAQASGVFCRQWDVYACFDPSGNNANGPVTCAFQFTLAIGPAGPWQVVAGDNATVIP